MSNIASRMTVVLTTLLSLVACSHKSVADIDGNLTMKPSVTYLHLLRHTPFFTALSKVQLQWVIDHSREWEVDSGATIAKCGKGFRSNGDYWILLDGGWQLNTDEAHLPSGHSDPGKWFSTQVANGKKCSLVATEHGYVMHITESEMQIMLNRGFPFQSHLDSGNQYYRLAFDKQ